MMSSGTPVPMYPKPGSVRGSIRYHAAPAGLSCASTATKPASPGRIHPEEM